MNHAVRLNRHRICAFGWPGDHGHRVPDLINTGLQPGEPLIGHKRGKPFKRLPSRGIANPTGMKPPC